MADSFSFESGKQFNKENFSFAYNHEWSWQKKNINKLIKFFDKDKSNRLSDNSRGYSKSSEATSLFKTIKKYIKDDGVFSDEEIGDFLSKHKELNGVSVNDFKNFINGENGNNTYSETTTTTESTMALSVHLYCPRGELNTKVLPTQTTITKTENQEVESIVIKKSHGYSNRPIYNKTTNYDENHNILNITETKNEYQIAYYEDNTYFVNGFDSKSVTETQYDNGKISQVSERKYKDQQANLIEEKTSYYTEGVLTKATKTQYIDGKTIVEEIAYKNNKPTIIEKYVNGELVSTSTYKENTVTIEFSPDGNRTETISSGCTTIFTQNADGSTVETTVKEVDNNGSYTSENFISKRIIKEDEAIIVEKFAINEIDSINKTSKTVGYQLIESIATPDGKVIQSTYNSNNIFDYEAGTIYMTSQTSIENGEMKTCLYDGNGNTYIVLQNGDCPSLIEKTFKPKDMSTEDFWTETYRLNMKNFDEENFEWNSYYKESILNHEKYNYIVGENFLVKGEIPVDDEKISSRNPAEDEIKEYNDWYYNEILKNVITTNYEKYTLNKDYKNVYELAEDILKNKFKQINASKNDINNYANELLLLNGQNLNSKNLQKNRELNITTFKRISKETQEKCGDLGISATNKDNHFFFLQLEKLNHYQEKEVLEFIEKYRTENNIRGELKSEDFEIIKTKILDKKGICLTNSGIYIKNSASVWSDTLTKEEKNKYDDKKISLEAFIKELGLDYTIPESEGEKLYLQLSCLPQDYLNQIPFGMVMQEAKNRCQNGTKITCNLINDLVEDYTLCNISIRLVDGKLDTETIKKRKKEILKSPPIEIQRLLQDSFKCSLNAIKQTLNDVEKETAWYQAGINWFAERLEDCGIDTDNKRDVTRKLNAEEFLIKNFYSNPELVFKGVTGLELTYENIEKVLEGNFELASLGCLEAYGENLAEYKAWTKAIVISAVSILATCICPISAFGALGTAGKIFNYGLNLVKTGTITGCADIAYDLLSGKENFNAFNSFKEGFMISTLMCTANTAGTLAMKAILPSSITSGAATTFSTLSFGNTYTASNAWANAGYYVLESGLQNFAMAAISNKDIVDFDNYKFSIFAGLCAIKINKFAKTNTIDDFNISAKINLSTENFESIRKTIEQLQNTATEALVVGIGLTSYHILRDGARYIMLENFTHIGDFTANAGILEENIVEETKNELNESNYRNYITFESQEALLEHLSTLQQNLEINPEEAQKIV